MQNAEQGETKDHELMSSRHRRPRVDDVNVVQPDDVDPTVAESLHEVVVPALSTQEDTLSSLNDLEEPLPDVTDIDTNICHACDSGDEW